MSLLGIILFWILLSNPTMAETVQNGIIDFQGRDWSTEDTASLSGEWTFLPYTFISEDAMRSGEWQSFPRTQVKIPAALLEAKGPDGKPLDEKVWGTMLLEVKNLKTPFEELAFRLRGDSAYTIYWLDSSRNAPWQKVMQVGVPGTSAKTSIPKTADAMGRIRLEGPGPHFLVIHISGFHYTRASIWTTPKLGSVQTIEQNLGLERLTEIFVCGMIFIMSIYYFSLFLHHREDTSTLWLSFYTISAFARLVATGGGVSAYIITEPNLSIYEFFRKLEFGTIMLMGTTTAMFVVKTLGYKKFETFVLWNVVLSLLVAGFCIVTTAEVYVPYLGIMNLYLLLCIIFIMTIAIHAVIKRKKGSGFLISGLTIIAFCTIYDMGVGFGYYPSAVFLAPFGLTALIYSQGQVIARLFASAFRTAKKLSVHLQEEVDRQTTVIRSMLNHIPQGVMSLNPSGKIDEAYSEHLIALLETNDIGGHTLNDLLLQHSDLSSDQKDRIVSALSATLGESSINFELNEGQFPKEINLQLASGKKILQVTWSPVLDKEDCVAKIMMTLHDITQVRIYEQEARVQREELEFIQEIVSIPLDRFALFIESSQRFLEENERLIKCNKSKNVEALKILFVNMHTIKGAARTLNFQMMAGTLHDVEQYYANLLSHPEETWNQERLLNDLKLAQSAVNRYERINSEVLGRKLSSQQNIIVDRDFMEQHAILLKKLAVELNNSILQDMIREARTKLEDLIFENTEDVFADIFSSAAKVAKDLNKLPPKVLIEGASFQVSYRAQHLLRNIFTHIIRNSLDHGIESETERLDKGKAPVGTIQLTIQEEQGFLLLKYQDDGRGLDLEKLRGRGRILGLLTQAEQASPQELAELIFHPGLSTADSITEHSGRGVGMGAVRRYVEEAGGKVELKLKDTLQSTIHRPFALAIYLPGGLYVRQGQDKELAA